MSDESSRLSYEEMRLLDLLVETEQLSLAAKRLGVSISTVSRQLARARTAAGDLLFVRSRSGLAPTNRMLSMAPKLRAILTAWDTLCDDKPFSPSEMTRELRIMCADNALNAYLNPAIPAIHQIACSASITIEPLSTDVFESLRRDAVDVAIFPAEALPADCRCLPLPPMHSVPVVRKDHPLAVRCRAAGKVSLEEIEAFPLICADPRLNRPHSPSSGGRAFFTMPYFNAAPPILRCTDYVFWCPLASAKLWVDDGALTILTTDRSVVPDWRPQLIWHVRTHADPALQWLRGMIIRYAAEQAKRYEAGRDRPPRAGRS